MPPQEIRGTVVRAQDRLDRLRDQIRERQFADLENVRQLINRYVVENPKQAQEKSTSLVDALIGNIHSELGLGSFTNPRVTQVISDHVRDLVYGRAQVSEDTARWAVHHAANQVVMYSGHFTYDADDIFIDGAGIDFAFHRSYKSQGFHNGSLGINWDHNYNLRLRMPDQDEKIIRMTGGFQESTYIRHGHYGTAGCNYWVPPPGEHNIIIATSQLADFGLQLPQDCAQCHYVLRTANGTQYFYEDDPGFAQRYRIRRVEDRLGNYLLFSYTPQVGSTGEVIAQIEVNSQYRIVYFDEYDAQGRLLRIRDYVGRIWHYTYDDFGDLIAFTTPGTDRYPEGLTERYVYTSDFHTGELQHKLVQIYDTAERMYLENEYGSNNGLLSFGRVVRQREGNGERTFEYEDVSLATGLPVGQPEIEEDLPAHQTTMVRRNGHPVHYIYNKFGNLIAREEDIWTSGVRCRLVTHFRYNRDGALIGEVSPEGRMTQYLYGRDKFTHEQGLLAEEDMRQSQDLTWQQRLSFGNRLAVIRRYTCTSLSSFTFPNPLRDVYSVAVDPHDIIVKFAYEPNWQQIKSVSHPEYTKSPFPDSPEDSAANNPAFHATLMRFLYKGSDRLLERIEYPNTTRDNAPDLQGIREQFLDYDPKGRLMLYEDRASTRLRMLYFPAVGPLDLAAPKEGYLWRQIIDPIDPQLNPNGLNLETIYEVNEVGSITAVTVPKGQTMTFIVDTLNRVTKVTRTLPQRINPETGALIPQVDYATRYAYCRNMRVERIERDVQDEGGQSLWGGTEVQFFRFDENDNIVREERGSPDFDDRLITRHDYDDGDLRVGTTLPRGNRIHIQYDERRLPRKIIRGFGTSEAAEVNVFYDSDGLLVVQRDGRNLKTKFDYDSFGRVVATSDFDTQDNLYRFVRHDYDKSGNLTVERLFVPDGHDFKLLYHAQYLYDALNQRIETRVRRFQAALSYSSADVNKNNDYVPPAEAVRTLYYYDKAGRIVRVEQRGKRLNAGGNPEPNETILATNYEYNGVGWMTAEMDALGNKTETRYDGHGLVTRVDVREKVSLADSPTGEEIFTIVYRYDELDRLSSITDGLGNITRYYYDSRDAIICQKDPLGNITRFAYDVYGRQVIECIEMTDAGLGGGPRQPDSDVITQHVYDANGNLIRIIDAHNTPTDQAYDALDRRIGLKYADGTATISRYDGNDNIVQMQDNNGLIRCMTYDPLDKLLRVDIDQTALQPNLTIEGATYEAFEHDIVGRMMHAKNDWADIHLKIDSQGRAYEESVQFPGLATTFTLRRDYDDFGFLTRLTYPNGRIILYKPDLLNRITHIDNQAYGINYPGCVDLPEQCMILENQYRGLRTGRKLYGNGTATTYAYDGAARVIGIAHTDAQNANLLILQHLYDAVDNMRFKYEYASGQAPYGEVYKYDSRYQLTHYPIVQPPQNSLNLKVFAPAQAMPLNNPQFNGQTLINGHLGQLAQTPDDFTFKYDKLGNRLEERQPNQAPIVYHVNNLNQYRLRGQVGYTYDANGNLSEEQSAVVRQYVYNHRNQLSRVVDGGVELVRFHYDALGRCIWGLRGIVSTFYLHDQENIVEEYHCADPQHPDQVSVAAQYINEAETDSRCLIAASGNEYWYHKDLVGTTRVLTDTYGGVTATYRFSPFGAWGLAMPLPATPNPCLFAGRLLEDSLDMYDFRAREYSVVHGRFMQRDPNRLNDSLHGIRNYGSKTHDSAGTEFRMTSALDVNLYLYVKNNPFTYRDVSGREPTPTDWQRKLVEGGAATIKNLQQQREYERLRYGFHRWYGADPMYIKGAVPRSRASFYERLGGGVASISQSDLETYGCHTRSECLVKWRERREKAPFWPEPKGCYGWVWEVIKGAYKYADQAADVNRFSTINRKSAGDFMWLVREQQKQGWKVIYFAADMRKVSPDERNTIESLLRKRGIKIDASIVNFASTASPRDTRGLEKLKKVGFWWGTETYGRGLGEHFFTGSQGTVTELNWRKNPNQRILETSKIERRLGAHGSGILIIPPGTW